MSRLTIRSIETLEPRKSAYIIFDERGGKFGVRVTPAGVKTYVIQYRAKGRVRKVALGRVGTLTPDEARKLAQTMLGRVSHGDDPAQERADYRGSSNLSAVCDRFVEAHVKQHCKPSTQKEYQRVVEKFIKPELGNRKVADITRADISKMHHDYRAFPYQANRTLGVLSKLFNLCEVWGLRPDGSNPCRHVPKNRENKKERFLSPEEIARLGALLDRLDATHEESPFVTAALRLLILTGCRLGEILKLEWASVKDGYLDLADTKTGPRRIPLPPAAQDILDNLPLIQGNPYVISGKNEKDHWNDLQRPWRRIRKMAKLTDVRIHDLRHTYASNAIRAGIDLAMVSKLLGHTQIHTTMRYVHLADDPIRKAAATVAAVLFTNLGAGPPRPALTLVK
jgi:integrase